MADIIIGYGNGEREFGVVFLYPIPTPKQINGANVVPTPATALPADIQALLISAEITGLNAGTIAYDLFTFSKEQSRSDADVVEDLKIKYDVMKARKTQWYVERYRYAGTRLNR